ncbi:MAG: hypothetical protein AB7F96_09175 [Beijerinckiaceae bacterium]
MKLDEFRKDHNVEGFVKYFSCYLKTWEVRYVSKNKRISVEDRNFHAAGIEEATKNYIWPASVGEEKICRWDKTSQKLIELSASLISSLRQSASDTKNICDKIIDWGMGSRGGSAKTYLDKTDLKNYLINTRKAIDQDDISKITCTLFDKMGSGLAKIHALANPGKLVILDSRVALAAGHAILEYLNHRKYNGKVPEHLNIGYCDHGRKPEDQNRSMKLLPRNHKWLIAQLKLSWLLRLTLEEDKTIFGGHEEATRLHMLEAGLFMFGADKAALEESSKA